MTEQIPVGMLLGFPVYGYSIFLCLSILIGLILMAFCQKERSLPKDAALRYGLWAIPLGVVGARLFYCLARFDYVLYERGWTFLFSLWEGGFALYGAMGGCLLAALVYGRVAHVKARDVLDCAAPGAAVLIAGARFAECFTAQGVGDPVEVEALQHFPFAVMNHYEEWVLPVFLLEGLAALATGLVVFRFLRRKGEKHGDAALIFLLLYGAAQVLLESLRRDDYLRWGFVRVSQLMSMGLVLFVATVFGARALAKKKVLLVVFGALVLMAGVLGCIAIEFALDKSSIPNDLLYIGMALALMLMTGAVLALFKARRGEPSSAKHEIGA